MNSYYADKDVNFTDNFARSGLVSVKSASSKDDRLVSVAAGQKIKKPTFGQIASSTAGNQSTAVVAWSDVERPFWPKFGRSPHLG